MVKTLVKTRIPTKHYFFRSSNDMTMSTTLLQDEHSGLTGYMYILKKLEVKSFDPKGVPKVSALPSLVNATMKEIEEYVSLSVLHINCICQKDVPDYLGLQYATKMLHASFQADQLPDNFTGHLKLCQAFFKLRLQRNVEILDVSAHVSSPGLVGRELQARSDFG